MPQIQLYAIINQIKLRRLVISLNFNANIQDEVNLNNQFIDFYQLYFSGYSKKDILDKIQIDKPTYIILENKIKKIISDMKNNQKDIVDEQKDLSSPPNSFESCLHKKIFINTINGQSFRQCSHCKSDLGNV